MSWEIVGDLLRLASAHHRCQQLVLLMEVEDTRHLWEAPAFEFRPGHEHVWFDRGLQMLPEVRPHPLFVSAAHL